MSSPAKPFGSPDHPSAYAPKRVRGGFVAQPARTGDADVTPPSFLLGASKERGLTDFTENSLQFEEGATREGLPQERQSESESRRRPQRASGGQAPGRDHATVDRRKDEIADEEELRRLEESIRLLQREAASDRVRGPDRLPAAPEPDRSRSHRRGEYIEGFPVPPSLQPEILSPPHELRRGRSRLQTLLAVVIAGVVAAPIAYYFSRGAGDPRFEPASEPKLAAVEPQPVAAASIPAASIPVAPSIPAPAPRTQPVENNDAAAMPNSPRAPRVAIVPKRAATPPAETREVAPPSASRNQAPPPPPARTLDPAEIELLVKQGQQFVAAGDFVTARTVFQRAAEGGNAVAALALGASYDPAVLASLGVRGVDADVSKARMWYQKAKDLGAPEAARRIDLLANR